MPVEAATVSDEASPLNDGDRIGHGRDITQHIVTFVTSALKVLGALWSLTWTRHVVKGKNKYECVHPGLAVLVQIQLRLY